MSAGSALPAARERESGAFDGSYACFGVDCTKGARVPMRDGTSLVADVYRPALDGEPLPDRFPTIVERTPYDRQRLDLFHSARYFASRGYNVVLQDSRGRYDSDGEFDFLTGPESEDGYDTISWIAAQEWSDGQVGTTGLSFTGANQHAVAVAQPEALKTQIVLDAGYNYWHRTVRYNGAFSAGIFFPYALWMALHGHEAAADPNVRATIKQGIDEIDLWLNRLPLKRGDSPLAAAPSYEKWYFDLAESTVYTTDWGTPQWNLPPHIDRYPDIPVCLVTSWYGHHAWANFEKFARLRERSDAPVHVVAGTWLHTFEYTAEPWSGEVHFGNSAAFGLDDFRVRWFDRWLKGLDTGVERDPPVRVFVMGGGAGVLGLDDRLQHGGEWRSADSWPLEGTDPVRRFLGAGGGLDEQGPEGADEGSSFVFDPADPVPTIGGSLQEPDAGAEHTLHGGAFDQRAHPELASCHGDTRPLGSRHDVLVFRTAVLTSDVVVAGAVRATLWVSSSAADTDFTVKLIDEYPPADGLPEGFAMNLVDGIVRMSYRGGRFEPEQIEPGQVYEVELELPPTANRFVAGHRIRIDVSSSSFPQFDVNDGSGDDGRPWSGKIVNTVFHDVSRPSSVELPVLVSAS